MSGVFEGQWTQSSPANIPGDLYIGGDITVVGSINTGGSGEGQIVDAINTVNYGETGAGVGGAGISGIEVDRGTETNFRFIFDESDDKFKSGLIGSMKVVTNGDVGTQGYIPFGITGGGQLTESANLFWDSANNRLGLGTSTPAATLDAVGVVRYGNNSDSVGALSYGTAKITLEALSANTTLGLSPSGTGDVLIAETSGNVGINQASPSEKLDMLGNARVDGNIIVTGTVDGVDVAAHKTSYDAHVADSSIHFTEASIDHANILNIGTNTHAQIDTAITNSTNHIADASIHFTEASIDHGSIAGLFDDDHVQYVLATGSRPFTGTMTVQTGGMTVNGKAGFGFPGPSAFGDVHIRSGVSGAASAPIAGDEFIIEGSGSSGMTILSGLAGGGHILFGDSGDNDAGFIRYTHGTDVLDFGVNGLGTVMTIDNTGDVGIGVASPTERLDVSGNIAVSGTVDGVDVAAHAADSTIHFTQASIDHTAILNVGTNTHAQIDTHIADATLHFTEASIDHGSIAGLGDDDHTQYALADGTRAFTGAVSGVTPTSSAHLATKAYVDSVSGGGGGSGTIGVRWQEDGLSPVANVVTFVNTYTVGGGTLVVFADGVKLRLGVDYNETTTSTITLIGDFAGASTSIDAFNFETGNFVQESAINAAGDIFVGTADDTVGILSAGSADQLLTISGGVPAWVTHDFALTTGDTFTGAVKVSTASSGVTPEVSADDLFVEGNTDSGITIGSGTVNTGKLNFARSTDNDAGQISFNHNTGTMGFRVEGSERYSVTNALFKTVIPMEVSVNNSAVTPNPNADDLFVENSVNSGITIGSGTTGLGSLHFGDSADSGIGALLYDHNSDELVLRSAGEEIMRLRDTANSGRSVVIGDDMGADDGKLNVLGSTSYNNEIITLGTRNTSYTGQVATYRCDRTRNAVWSHAWWYANSAADPLFHFKGDSNAYADTWNPGGADYAEYFESTDGSKLADGTTVVLEGSKVRAALEGETPIGVVSATAGVVGNNGLTWKGRYLRDEFGRYQTEENGDFIDNPEYDPDQEYVMREDRDEWNAIGLVGQIRVKKGQPVAPNWILMEELSENVDLYFVK